VALSTDTATSFFQMTLKHCPPRYATEKRGTFREAADEYDASRREVYRIACDVREHSIPLIDLIEAVRRRTLAEACLMFAAGYGEIGPDGRSWSAWAATWLRRLRDVKLSEDP
jgi:hypothetical protein